jgi:hypothetical protein
MPVGHRLVTDTKPESCDTGGGRADLALRARSGLFPGLWFAGQALKPHRPRGAVTGEPPAGRTRDADGRGSPAVVHAGCRPACRGRETGTRTNRPAFLRRLVPVPISRPHPRSARARPLADRRSARSPASHDPRGSASIRDSCLPAGRHEPRRPARSQILGRWDRGTQIRSLFPDRSGLFVCGDSAAAERAVSSGRGASPWLRYSDFSEGNRCF